MNKATFYLAVLGAVILSVAGCGGSNNNNGNPGGAESVPVIITMQDQPPTGVTTLDFSVTVTGVQLTGDNIANVQLLTNPVTVQLGNLQTGSAVIANTTAPAGTYSNIMITFSSPITTVENGSTTSINAGGETCATGQTCTLNLSLNQASTTTSSTPFPLTLTASNPVELNVDLNLNSSLQSDFSLTPSVTVSSVTAANGNFGTMTVSGQIAQTGSNQFTVTDSNTGDPVVLTTNGTTSFTGFNTNTTNCVTANTFGCLGTNQNVMVSFNIPQGSPSTPTATVVTSEPGITNGIEGTVISTNPSMNQFTMVVDGFSPTQTGVTVGQTLVVTLASGATFEVEPTGSTVSSGLSFASTNDLIAGQTVEIDATSASGTGGTATADVALLVPSEFTGNVTTVAGNNLTLNGLDGVFTNGGFNTVTVDTGTGTVFTGVNDVTGLTLNQPVTIGGEVFNTSGGVVVVGGNVNQVTTSTAAMRLSH